MIKKKKRRKRKKVTYWAMSRELFKKKKIHIKVFFRDGFTCRLCGKSEGVKLNAHHLVPFSHSPSLRADIINLITVCEDCHEKICHNGDFRSINLDISVQYLIENLKHKRVVVNKKHFLDYFSRHRTSYPELINTLNKKRIRPKKRKVIK